MMDLEKELTYGFYSKKHFLSFLIVVLLSLGAYSQTSISTKEQFLAIQQNPSGSYIQTANIDLGNFDQTTAIIQDFSGTYDGGGYSITYNANFTVNTDNVALGLFGIATGTIQNLNITSSSLTVTGNKSARIGLLCGYLNGTSAIITNCHITTGTINSTNFNTDANARVSTGLLVGEMYNSTVKYSSASSSVSAFGYAGGLIGRTQSQNSGNHATILGCSFTGDVSATYERTGGWEDGLGSFFGTGR